MPWLTASWLNDVSGKKVFWKFTVCSFIELTCVASALNCYNIFAYFKFRYFWMQIINPGTKNRFYELFPSEKREFPNIANG